LVLVVEPRGLGCEGEHRDAEVRVFDRSACEEEEPRYRGEGRDEGK
jgi:hypothetical protein